MRWFQKPNPVLSPAMEAARRQTSHERRRQEARDDRYIAAMEHGDPGNTADPEIMRREHEKLEAAGLLDPDQPTTWSDYLHRQVRRDVAEAEPWEREAMADALELHSGRDQ